MPGGSSAVKEEPIKAGSSPSLLPATGSVLDGAGKDDHIVDPTEGLWLPHQPMPLLLKECADGRNTVY